MSSYVLDRATIFLCCECRFTQTLIFHTLSARMSVETNVGEIDFSQAIAADQQDPVEGDIIPNSPRNHNANREDTHGENRSPPSPTIQ